MLSFVGTLKLKPAFPEPDEALDPKEKLANIDSFFFSSSFGFSGTSTLSCFNVGVVVKVNPLRENLTVSLAVSALVAGVATALEEVGAELTRGLMVVFEGSKPNRKPTGIKTSSLKDKNKQRRSFHEYLFHYRTEPHTQNILPLRKKK